MLLYRIQQQNITKSLIIFPFLGIDERIVMGLNSRVITHGARTAEVMTFRDRLVTILAKHGMPFLKIQAMIRMVHGSQGIRLAIFTCITMKPLHLTGGFRLWKR